MENPNPKKDGLPGQTQDGTGQDGKPEINPADGVALTPEERKELEELREIKKGPGGFKKFAESAREAQRLFRRVNELEEKLELSNAAPSEEEMKQAYPEFEDMSPDEQKKAIEMMKKEKYLKILEAKQKMREDYDALPEDIKNRIEKSGGFLTFKDFACSPENAGQKSLLNLAKQYLYDNEESDLGSGPENPPRDGLEPGVGGPTNPEPPKEEGYTPAELKEMRESDPEKYNKLAREGKLTGKRKK